MKNIVLFGPGQVGQTVLEQLLENKYQQNNYRIIAIADSTGLMLDMDGLSPERLRRLIPVKRLHQPLNTLDGCACLDLLPQCYSPDTILVDTSASDDLLDELLTGLEQGCAIVMANKKNLTQTWQRSAPFFQSRRVRYESTVCAAVPVMSSIARLVRAEDKVTEISGSLSGTLGFLCSQFDQGMSYSEAVTTAHQLGFTEPDPRDDLGGIDVARKALIMARANGWTLEMKDISVEPLYTEELANLSPRQFLSRCAIMDQSFAERLQAAHQEGKVLRYIANVNPQGGETRITAVTTYSEFGSLQGTGNRVVIHSRYHRDNPLVISGAGAGAALTASGVVADIMELIDEGRI